MRSLIICCLALGLMTQSLLVKAQDKQPKWGIKYSPPHLLNAILRFEVEKNFGNSRHSLTLSPFYYMRNLWSHRKDTLSGVGAELMHRIYLEKQDNLKGLYCSYGVSYRYLSFKTKYLGWQEKTEEGLSYLYYGKINEPLEVHRISGMVTIGYQFVLNRLIINMYNGLAYKHHFSPQANIALKR